MGISKIAYLMEDSTFHRIKYTETDGSIYTGYVAVFESADDNDEGEGASICVKRDDGVNVIVYEDEIKEISIID